MRRSLVTLAAVASLALTGTNVPADDFAPPWWRDKHPDPVVNRSTWQQWEFETSEDGSSLPSGIIPDDYVNPLFDPNNPAVAPLGAAVSHAPGHDWMSEHEGRTGVWPLSGGEAMVIQIPNYSDGPEKKVWVQLTWTPADPQDPGDVPDIGAIAFAPGHLPLTADLEFVHNWDAEGVWVHSLALLMFDPNPLFETIQITGDILVDEVFVDTICPEPTTMILLGLTAPFVLKRRIKR